MWRGIGSCGDTKLAVDDVDSDRWAIASVTTKGALGMTVTIFDLVNARTYRAHRLKVTAGGVGAGSPVTYSPESSMSNYAYFSTSHPVNFDAFDGVGARIIGGSALLYSWSSLTLWEGAAYTSRGLATARMSGWGVATPGGSVDHGVAQLIYCDGDPIGVPQLPVNISVPPSPEQIHPHVEITVQDDSLVVILRGDVLFDFDKSAIKPEGNAALEQAAAILRSQVRAESTVQINGYTDNVGTDAYNLRLSQQRAEAAATWFVSRKYLPASKIVSDGFGAAVPVAPNGDAAGRARNRRVEIFVRNR